MRAFALCAALAAAAACALGPASHAGSPSRGTPERRVAPATRLVLPAERAPGDLDCADFADQAAAQDALRGRPRDPHGLDADRDGIACEHLVRR